MDDKFPAIVQMRPSPEGLRLGRGPAAARSENTHPAAQWFKSGRFALEFVLREITDSPGGGAVLLPAYHCTAMVDACDRAGLEVRYFGVNADLTPDIDSLTSLLDESVRAAVLVYYFGFPTISPEVVELLTDTGIPIIEDAAHIDPLSPWPAYVGKSGAWIIASPRKFYPIYDGGYAAKLDPPFQAASRPRPATPRDELRAASFLVTQWQMRRDRAARLTGAQNSERPDAGIEVDNGRAAASAPDASDNYRDERFEPVGATGMTRVSYLLAAKCGYRDHAENRRENYRRLASTLSELDAADALYPTLRDGTTVPYVFPCILRDPENAHRRLRDLGIEILRWEDLESDNCLVSREYTSTLVQIPCHDGLSERQMDYLLETLIDVLN